MARLITRARQVFVLVVAAAVGAPVTGHAQATGSPETARALAVSYADGRTSYRVLRPGGGGFWTPQFPVVPGADTTRNGLPLWALQIDHTIDGSEVVATVSLLYGRPHRDRVPVATVRVGAGGPVRVEELAAFGVEPVTLSIVAVAPSLAYPLSVVCASGQLDVRVDPVSPDLPAYALTVENLSPRALMAFEFETYRGDRRIGGGRRKTASNEPLVEPGGQSVTELGGGGSVPARDEARAWPALDRLVVTSVLWDDGSVEGDLGLLTSERALAAGRATQLPRILALLREAADPARPQTPAELRLAIDALSGAVGARDVEALRVRLPDPAAVPAVDLVRSMQTGLLHARGAALADLDGFERVVPDGDPVEFRQWLSEATVEYEAWLARVRR